jgi:hypothetical protein
MLVGSNLVASRHQDELKKSDGKSSVASAGDVCRGLWVRRIPGLIDVAALDVR